MVASVELDFFENKWFQAVAQIVLPEGVGKWREPSSSNRDAYQRPLGVH
jgi:hypothetical protein